ncbi:two-component system LytT family response regulator [Pedobacter sp. UYEF25]
MKQNNHLPSRCLVIDDDPSFVFLMSSYIHEIPKLQLWGEYLNPQTAMECITEEDKIDFVFLDVRMGKISGIEVAEYLRDKVKYIVFISASAEYVQEALRVGGDHYLVKPVMFSKFLETVNEVLKRNRYLTVLDF